MAILIICGMAAFWGMRYLLFTEAARKVEAAVATVQKITGPEDQGGNYNHVDLDDPELTASTDNGVLLVQITTPDGRVLNSSQALGNAVLAPGYSGPPVLAEFNKQDVILAGSELTGGALVQVAYPVSREKHFLGILAGVLGFLALGGLILAVAGGWLIARKALRPLQDLTSTARRISATDLSRRIALDGSRDELYILAETFNHMLDRLEKGFRSQQEFVAAASHDLRTPLTIIKSYADLLRRWGKDDRAVVEESVQAMIKAVGFMERLVNDLLLLARMQARPSFEIMPLSLGVLAEETVQEARALSGDINIKLDTVDQAVVAADEYYLRRALWALVDNAVKYNRPGGEVAVSVAVNKNKGEASLSVTDTGPGIDAGDLPRIFDRFYCGDPARTQGKGFGLGLSLAKEIVEAHRGRITVDSQPGKGSRFTIVLSLMQMERNRCLTDHGKRDPEGGAFAR
jgi:signal transduction histidine kinase